MAMDLTRLHFGVGDRYVDPRTPERMLLTVIGEPWWYTAAGPGAESAARVWLEGASIESISTMGGVTLELGCL